MNPCNQINSKSLNLKQEQRDESSFNNLPEEVIYEVFKFLEASEAVKSERVCRKWKNLLEEEKLWESFYTRDFEIASPMGDQSVRQLYQERRLCYENLSKGIYSKRTIWEPDFSKGQTYEIPFLTADEKIVLISKWRLQQSVLIEVKVTDWKMNCLKQKKIVGVTEISAKLMTNNGILILGIQDYAIAVFDLNTATAPVRSLIGHQKKLLLLVLILSKINLHLAMKKGSLKYGTLITLNRPRANS